MRKIILSLAFITAIAATSCKKYLDDAYKNPNLDTSAPPEEVLQSCISNMHYGMAFDARQLGFYVQNFASVVGLNQWERQGYLLTGGSANQGSDTYRMHYWNMGFNIIDMIDSGKVSGKFDYVAASYSLNAWSWMVTADQYGEMPVLQAFEKGRLAFDYDNQDVAYNLSIRYCDSALAYWNRAAAMTAPTLAIGDAFFYRGDQAKWKKFVYGLKARLYSRWGNKAGFITNQADSVIKYVDLAFASTADDAMVRFDINKPLTNSRNFFGPTRGNVGGFRVGAFPAAILSRNLTTIVGAPSSNVFGNLIDDPRANYMFRPSPDGIHRGIICNQQADNGTTPTDRRVPSFWGTVAQTASPGLGVDTGARTFFRNDAPFPIMTYSELQFLKAEILLKKGQNAAAKTAFENGINGHIDMLNTHFTGYLQPLGVNSPATFTNVQISPASRALLIGDPFLNPPANALSLRHIMCQKYIACYGWGFAETWVDMRKYDFADAVYPNATMANPNFYSILPLISLFPDNAGKQAHRIRPRYDSEYLWNIPALTSVGGFAIDYHTKKTWFAQP
jgi:hypothetical protein